MISNEQIAHDLAMVYLSNKYGIDVRGSFHVSDGDGSGDVFTTHMPGTEEKKYKKTGTGEKGFLGIEKKRIVEVGYAVDDLFANMISDYRQAYTHFLNLL